MRKFGNSPAFAYTVEVNPASWLSVGRMSADAYRQVLAALDQIADSATSSPVSSEGLRASGDAPLMLVVNDEIEVRFEIDTVRRVVRLVDLRWRK